MKKRFFIAALILLVLFSCGILFKADSQIQPAPTKFKVAVKVSCEDNQAHQSQLEGTIKRELRSFGDVQIVGNNISNGLWEYLINVDLYGIKNNYGNIHHYAISTELYRKIPIKDIVPHWQEFYRKYPAVYLPTSYTGFVGIEKIEEMGKSIAANFDNKSLQHIRDLSIR
jgi:hypothetical protein